MYHVSLRVASFLPEVLGRQVQLLAGWVGGWVGCAGRHKAYNVDTQLYIQKGA